MLAPVPKRGAPRTQVGSFGTLLRVASEFVEVNVEGQIVRDSTAEHPHTRFTFPAYTFELNAKTRDGKVEGLTGKFRWVGAVTVATSYPASSQREDYSCYGRGTTDSDRHAGNTSLGFHESRHRQDYRAFLLEHVLPAPPQLRNGMSVEAFQAALPTFERAFEGYKEEMRVDSLSKTDEVGHTISRYRQAGCYVHQAR